MVAMMEKPAEKVGQLEFRVVVAEPTPESKQRWSRRAEVLTAWLLAEWRRERKEAS